MIFSSSCHVRPSIYAKDFMNSIFNLTEKDLCLNVKFLLSQKDLMQYPNIIRCSYQIATKRTFQRQNKKDL